MLYFLLSWLHGLGVQALVRAPNARHPPSCAPAPPGWRERTSVSSGEPIHTWVRTPPQKLGTVLVLHGLRDEKSSYEGFGSQLAARGFQTVLVDLRGHGCSPGATLTFGARDGVALRVLLDVLEREEDLGAVGVVGVSYGAAAAFALAAADERVRALVSVAGPSSVLGLVRDYLSRKLGSASAYVPASHLRRVVRDAGRLAGFDPARVSMAAWAAETEAALLLIHGEADRDIRVRHAYELAAAADHAALWIRQGRKHRNVLDEADFGADSPILDWLERELLAPAAAGQPGR